MTGLIRMRVLPRLIPIDGKNIELQATDTEIQWRQEGQDTWQELVPLSDLKGDQGDQGDAGSPGAQGPAGDGFLMWAASDEVTPVSASTGKLQKRFPYAFTMTGIRAALVTAQTSGSLFTVDVKWWNGSSWASILSTLITFDNTERTSVTAATAPVLSKTSFADDNEFRIDVTQIGDGTAKGLSVTFLGNRT